jgi:hypothetical protein
METYKKIGNYSFKLENSDVNDFEFCDFVKMFCFHRRYNIGDKHTYNSENFSRWDEFKAQLEKDYDIRVILPLYMYEHGGITISTTPFSCPWDSGQIGFVFATAEGIRDNFGVKRITKDILKRTERLLADEVSLYDAFLIGDMYNVCMYDESGEFITSNYFVSYNDIDEEIDHMYSEYGEEVLV